MLSWIDQSFDYANITNYGHIKWDYSIFGKLGDLVFYRRGKKVVVRYAPTVHHLSENSRKSATDFGNASRNAAYIRKAQLQNLFPIQSNFKTMRCAYFLYCYKKKRIEPTNTKQFAYPRSFELTSSLYTIGVIANRFLMPDPGADSVSLTASSYIVIALNRYTFNCPLKFLTKPKWAVFSVEEGRFRK